MIAKTGINMLTCSSQRKGGEESHDAPFLCIAVAADVVHLVPFVTLSPLLFPFLLDWAMINDLSEV